MSNPFVDIYASITGSREAALEFISGFQQLDLAIPIPSEETTRDEFVVCYTTLPLAPVQISLDTMIPEEFATKYVAITLILNQYLFTASQARSQWNIDKEDNHLEYLNLDSLESAAYGKYLAENPGAKATDAKKYASTTVSEEKIRVAEREADIRSQIEICDNAIRYLNGIKEVMNSYANIFPHVRDYQADANQKYQGALTKAFTEAKVGVIVDESEEDIALKASARRRSIAQSL